MAVKKLKVLHLLQSNKFSGAENVVCQIVSMFKDNSDIEMAYCSRDGEIREALDERNIKFLPIADLKISEVKRVIKEYKPDIIHAHDMRAAVVAACSKGKIKLISHIHNNNFDSRSLSLKSILFLLAGVRSKHIFWVSKGSYEGYAFHSLFKKKSEVLYNVLNIEAIYKKADADTNEYNYDVVYLGRLTELKNPLRMINILSEVIKKNSLIKVAIIGSGDLEEECKKLCSELKLNDNVDFLGFMDNPLKILKSAKVMIMTSRTEGTPMSALESLALGTPIVSTPVGGLCELIENGVNGYLTDDDVVFAESILKIVEDVKLREDLSKSALEKCRKICDVEKYRNSLLKVYCE